MIVVIRRTNNFGQLGQISEVSSCAPGYILQNKKCVKALAGGAAGTVVITKTSSSNRSMFVFQVTGISKGSYSGNMRDNHANFNRKVTSFFQNAFTSYGDEVFGGLYQKGFLSASGETTLSAAQTKAKLIQFANESGVKTGGLGGTEFVEFDQKTIAAIKGGASLQQTSVPKTLKNTPAPKVVTIPGTEYELPDITGGSFFDNLALGLGVSVPMAMLGAGIVAIIALRR